MAEQPRPGRWSEGATCLGTRSLPRTTAVTNSLEYSMASSLQGKPRGCQGRGGVRCSRAGLALALQDPLGSGAACSLPAYPVGKALLGLDPRVHLAFARTPTSTLQAVPGFPYD